MASYIDLAPFIVGNNDQRTTLLNKISVAATVMADVIRSEDPSGINFNNRLAWAQKVLVDPRSVAEPLLNALLGQNNTSTINTILNSSDNVIFTNVSGAVDIVSGI